MIKKILIALAIVFVVIQFVRPEKNNSGDNQYDISTKYNVPPEIGTLLNGACNDCHSNQTRYPWYSNIQPVAWWLNNHVTEGKRHLNFSEFTKRRAAIQFHKLEEIAEMVQKEEMPLPSYTLLGLHPDANLSDKERETLVLWAQGQMAMMQVMYPADSLVMKR
jgi:hypothetical protein